MDDVRPARPQVDVRDGKTDRRVRRWVLHLCFWVVVIVLLAFLAPGTLPVLKLALHWVTGIGWLVFAATAWKSRARFAGIPVPWVLAGAGAAFLVLAAVDTYAALT